MATNCVGNELECDTDCSTAEELALANTWLSSSVNINETPDPATINRGISKLYQNDTAILEYISTIISTSFSDGIVGCIKALEQSCVRLDMEYITNNLCIDTLSDEIDASIERAMDDLTDVCLTTLSHGDTITWDSNTECFTNTPVETIGTVVQMENVLGKISDIASSSNTFGDDRTELVPVTNQYDINIVDINYTELGLVVEAESITSINIIARNFGRYDTETPTAQKWKTEALLSTGWTELQSYIAFNVDDDGGIATFVEVPYKESFNLGVISLRQVLSNANITGDYAFDIDGFPVNSITVDSVTYSQTKTNVAFAKTEIIKGYVEERAVSDGSIDSTTMPETTLSNYSSTLGVEADWTNIFDLVVPPSTYLTDITIDLSSIHAGAVEVAGDDPGSVDGGGSVASADGHIVIDWALNTVKGHLSYYTTNALADIKAVYFDGAVGTVVNGLNGGISTLDVLSSISTGNKLIKSLPVVCDFVSNDILTRNVSYKIKHYHIADLSVIEQAFETQLPIVTDEALTIAPPNSIIQFVQANMGAHELKNVALPDSDVTPIGTRVTFVKSFVGDLLIYTPTFDTIINETNLYNTTESESWGAKITLMLVSDGNWIIDNAVGTWHSDASQLT